MVQGYEKQLKIYQEAEEAVKGYYIVIDVGGMGKRDKQLLDIKNKTNAEGKASSEIVFVDGTRKVSASKA